VPTEASSLRAYTIEEAAELLSCDPQWLEEQARERKITYTELSGACHFTSDHITAIAKAYEAPSHGTVNPDQLAHTADQAAAIIGGTVKGSWLKQQAREGKVPCTVMGGAYHFTDEQLAEIIRIFEVRSREVTPPGAPRNPVLPEPAPGREHAPLKARAPRARGKRGSP
jgi:hypothetical protein